MFCLATRQAIVYARNKINSTPKTLNSLDEKLELFPNDLNYTLNSSFEINASVLTNVQGFHCEDGIVKGKLSIIMFSNLPSENNREREGEEDNLEILKCKPVLVAWTVLIDLRTYNI